MFDKF